MIPEEFLINDTRDISDFQRNPFQDMPLKM